jgi:hypothetical protein
MRANCRRTSFGASRKRGEIETFRTRTRTDEYKLLSIQNAMGGQQSKPEDIQAIATSTVNYEPPFGAPVKVGPAALTAWV